MANINNNKKYRKNGYQAKATEIEETEEEKQTDHSQIVIGTREIKIEF